MSNIMLTYRCNLACEYCFANEFVNEENVDITWENYLFAKDFLLSSGDGHIGLIGGEPTIYSQFGDILSDLKKDDRVTAVTIYTNGLEIDRYIELIQDTKFNLLVNCNSDIALGKRYQKMVDNIKLLYTLVNAKQRITLGINLYSDDLDYSYIMQIAKENDVHRLRMSLTVPNLNEKRNMNALDYFSTRKNYLFNFLHRCDDEMIVPYFDCNIVPKCIWDEDEYTWICQYIEKYRVKRTNLLGDMCICRPVIDILPNLQGIRCFGLSETTKVDIRNFKEYSDLLGYYSNLVDSYAGHICVDNSCEECYNRKVKRCYSGCLAFSEGVIEKATGKMDYV